MTFREKLNSTLNFEGIDFSEWMPASNVLIGLVLSTFFINFLSMIFPLSLLQVYDRIIPNEATNTLYILVMGVLCALFIEMLLKIARSYVAAWGDSRLSYKAGFKAFHHLLYSDLNEYEKEGAGVHLERLNNLDNIKDFYGGQIIITLMDLPFLFAYLALIAYIAHSLVIVPIVLQILLIISVIVSSKETLEHLHKDNDIKKINLNFMVELFSGICTIKSLAMEEQIISRYNRLQKTSLKEALALSQKKSEISRLISFFSQINLVLIVGCGVIYVIDGTMSIGGLAACTLLSGKSTQPIGKFMNIWVKLQSIKVSIAGHDKIMELPQECNLDAPEIGNIHGDLVIENLSFKYPNTNNFILSNINLTVKPGEFIGIIGNGESGKTTLMSILGGLMHPTTGTVKVNNKDIYQYNLQHVRNLIGSLTQRANLFEGSIMDNLTTFREGEYIDKAYDIISKLGLKQEIEKMGEGYQTKVGSGAIELVSKGFKQSLIIARILINQPKIILFDEANSAMDIAADIKLQNYFATLKGKCTVFLVTQRPSTLKIADRIFYLKNKKLELKTS